MKKIYFLGAMALLSHVSFSQTEKTSMKSVVEIGSPLNQNIPVSSSQGFSRSTIVNHMVNFTDAHTGYYSSTPSGFFRTIFPDSTTPAQYTSSIGYTYVHAAAQVFDLSSDVINSEVGTLIDRFDPAIPASLDSINTFGYYSKGSKGYVDTLVVTVVDYIGFFGFYQSSVISQWGDSVRSFAIEIDTNTFEPKNQLAQYKIPLNLSDTLPDGLMYNKFPAGVSVDSRFGITVQFKPGGIYTSSDTINKQLGMYRLYTSEPNGAGTSMSYIKNDMSGGQFYTKFDKYNSPTDRYFASVFQYPAGQSDNFEIEAVLSQTNSISVKENSNEAKLFQNYPNPANEFTTVRYALENNADVTFEVMDVTGKKVISTFEGNRNAGTHTIEINSNELNAGLYFYSIVVNGNRITKKMTITK